MKSIGKIAILGPESSGKTTLCQQLAKYYSSPIVTEIAREFLDRQGGNYKQEDLLLIAKEQLAEENQMSYDPGQFLICDTNLLNILIWSEVKYGSIDPELKELWNPNEYQLSLICYPDLPYESDELREHPDLEDRLHLFHLHEEYLKASDSNYVIIKGIGKKRLQNAIEAIDELRI